MPEWMTKRANRRQQVRQQKARAAGSWHVRVFKRVLSWPILASVVFVCATSVVALLAEATLGYSIGQRIAQPIYARVAFQVSDAAKTAADREAAKRNTPSYYSPNAPALTFGRIRADLMRLYQAAVDAETFEDYKKSLDELKWPAKNKAYDRLRRLRSDDGRTQFQAWVNELPLEKQYIVRNRLGEERDPVSATDFVRLESPTSGGEVTVRDIPHRQLVPHENEQARQGSATAVARKFWLQDLVANVEAIVLAAFTDQPTIVFDKERTTKEMREAEEATPVAYAKYEAAKPFVGPVTVLSQTDYELLRAERAAYDAFLGREGLDSALERRVVLLERLGLVTLVAVLTIALLAYTGSHQPRVFLVVSRTVAFMALILGTLLGARLLDVSWPQFPELVFGPCLIAASILAIVYPQRFAIGAICIVAVMVTTMIGGSIPFLLTLTTGVVVLASQLEEIRTRTKLITAGAVTAAAVMVVSAGGALFDRHTYGYVITHSLASGTTALAAAFIVSGVLPLIERLFRIATSLTLLEWRDPTRPLLQLLAREAPGTYNHSLVLGTLAEAACNHIGANGLRAQVGALYHDIGKIHKADYFIENQEGQINRHDNLAPTMSLLIILGHVKDGIEMAKEYKLPRVLHPFIEEHHGTTVVRYFHSMASAQQPRIASGKHDRKVPEAEFRYAGPKPRARESAVLMLCDGVEGAVRALPEPTPSRIEGVVHHLVMDRLNDGQFDDCDITLREIRQVEDSLVKSLCSIYHGRVAYPKARKPESGESSGRAKMSG